MQLERKAGGRIRNLANTITLSRIVFAAAMAFAPPFSRVFWICYACGGLSDLLDGPLARRLNRQSDAGAKLDSAADLVFAVAVFVAVVRRAAFPAWLWLCMAGIALLKVIGYGIGFYRFRTFAGLHTVLNKAAGACIFIFPVMYAVMGLAGAGAIICSIAFFASVEELVILVKSEKLDRNRTSIFASKEDQYVCIFEGCLPVDRSGHRHCGVRSKPRKNKEAAEQRR